MTDKIWTASTVARVMRAVLIGHIASIVLAIVLAQLVVRP